MGFQSHRHRRGSGTRQLRVEQGYDLICYLSGKVCAGIEQSEIARIGHLYDAVLHLLNRPAHGLLERARAAEVEGLEFLAEFLRIEGRRHGARLHAP